MRNTSTFGGGLAIYIKSCYPFAMDDKINNLNLIKLEALAVKTFLDNSHVTLVVIYRAPGTKISDTFLDIENILSNIDSSRVIIAGDINLDILRDDSVNDRYLNKIISHNLNQIVKCETRITHNWASLLDHILTNIPSARAIVSNYQLSDHQVLFCLFNKGIKKSYSNPKKSIHKEILNYAKTIENIQSIDWKDWADIHQNSRVDDTYSSFHSIIQGCLVFENKKFDRKKYPIEPWLTTAANRK